MKMQISKTFRFEASHILPKHPGKCSRLHGHSWVLRVSVEGKINPDTGFVKDYAEISAVVKPLIERLDHRHLGAWPSEIFGLYAPSDTVAGLPLAFYPSSENLLIWIGNELASVLDWSEISLNETCTSEATLTRTEWADKG